MIWRKIKNKSIAQTLEGSMKEKTRRLEIVLIIGFIENIKNYFIHLVRLKHIGVFFPKIENHCFSTYLSEL